jgi:GDP-L-fucose synthase
MNTRLLATDAPIFVAGHRGVVGSALVRALNARGCNNLLLRTRSQMDLCDASVVDTFFGESKPRVVFMAAARVGGIAANMAAPVEFLVENLRIQDHVLNACQRHKVEMTVFLGSSCIYPREAPQPMKEEYFMHGPLEPTNESYAVAKIAGIRLSQALNQQHGMSVVCPMPSNVYGPGDHFEYERSHVVSALVRRFAQAQAQGAESITLWGTGSARREFLFADDLADACLFLVENHRSPEIINVGSGVDNTIAEIAQRISDLVGYQGIVKWDTTKPDGMPQKLLDVSFLRQLGWRHKVELDQGLALVLADFRRRYGTVSEDLDES